MTLRLLQVNDDLGFPKHPFLVLCEGAGKLFVMDPHDLEGYVEIGTWRDTAEGALSFGDWWDTAEAVDDDDLFGTCQRAYEAGVQAATDQGGQA